MRKIVYAIVPSSLKNQFVKEILKTADDLSKKGQDKLAYLLADYAYKDVPQNIVDKIRAKIEKNII